MPLALTSFAAMPLPAVLAAPPAADAGSVSPLTVADRLITMAQEAERAGFNAIASKLIHTVFSVLDEHAMAS